MNSLEKLDAALKGAEGFEPEDEQTARMLQALQMMKPLILGMIPGTAQELDAQLLGISGWLLGLYSDTVRGEDVRAIVEAIEVLQRNSAESLTALVEEGGA